MQARERSERKERAAREEKERDARAKLARDAEESERRRRKAGAADAAANYQTLLSETVKDPDANWHEWRERLARDPQVHCTFSVFRSHLWCPLGICGSLLTPALSRVPVACLVLW